MYDKFWEHKIRSEECYNSNYFDKRYESLWTLTEAQTFGKVAHLVGPEVSIHLSVQIGPHQYIRHAQISGSLVVECYVYYIFYLLGYCFNFSSERSEKI